MSFPDNSSDYANVSQGIDRITDILKQQSTPVASSPYYPQAVNLPDNILNMLSGSSMAFGANHPGTNFSQGVQNYAHTQQDDAINQQKMLFNAYETKLKMGDAQTKALDDKINMFTGGDEDGKAMFLQALHDDSESIDPSNSFQVMTKLAAIKKQTGYESPDLKMEKDAKQLGLLKTRAEIGRLNKEAETGGGNTPAPLQLANEFQKARNSGDTQRMQDIIMFAKALDKGQTITPTGEVANITGAPEAAGAINLAKAKGTEAGKQQGEAVSDLNAAEAAMPQLEAATKTLSDLGKKATYTTVGRGLNLASKETGLGATEGGIARSAYIAHVKNNVLPLLRRTFGAQFTKTEGDSLLATLGDPNSTPQEKDAVLQAFIEDKKATLNTLRRETGKSPSAPIQQPKFLGFE